MIHVNMFLLESNIPIPIPVQYSKYLEYKIYLFSVLHILNQTHSKFCSGACQLHHHLLHCDERSDLLFYDFCQLVCFALVVLQCTQI